MTGSKGYEGQILPNTTTFYNKITETVEKGRAADVVYLGFSKAFDIVTHISSLTTLESIS